MQEQKQYRDIPLSELKLPSKYKRLISRIRHINANIASKRLQNKIPIPETREGILSLDTEYFRSFNGVGTVLLSLLAELKDVLINLDLEDSSPFKNKDPNIYLIHKALKTIAPQIPISYVSLPITNFRTITNQERLLVTKLGCKELNDLLNIKEEIYNNLSKNNQKAMLELIKKLPAWIDSFDKYHYINKDGTINFKKFELQLITDTEEFLLSLDEKQRNIALNLWGYNHEKTTQENLANQYQVTKQRIYSIIKKINSTFQNSLLFDIEPIKKSLLEGPFDLNNKFTKLAKYFTATSDFYEFVEICLNLNKNTLCRLSQNKNKKLFSEFFCTHESPISKDSFINKLKSEYSFNDTESLQIMHGFIANNHLVETANGLKPQNLGRHEAIAHILISHPNGLPWKDIAQISNKQKYSSVEMSENKLGSGFKDSDLIYLCSQGCYRHTMYLDFSQYNLDKIANDLKTFLEQQNNDTIHLLEYFNSTTQPQSEYFIIRYLIKQCGKQYGISFKGKSGVDLVSLTTEPNSYSQKDVIIKMLDQAERGLTKSEITKFIRSKSTKHVASYLNELINQGFVVRVDQTIYTTPQKAFGKINTSEILDIIKDIIESTDLIVEADYFRSIVNQKLNYTYSKFFYSALIDVNLSQYGWHKSRTLVCKSPFSYNNLSDIFSKNCNPSMTDQENLEKLKQCVLTTDATAKRIISNQR